MTRFGRAWNDRRLAPLPLKSTPVRFRYAADFKQSGARYAIHLNNLANSGAFVAAATTVLIRVFVAFGLRAGQSSGSESNARRLSSNHACIAWESSMSAFIRFMASR